MGFSLMTSNLAFLAPNSNLSVPKRSPATGMFPLYLPPSESRLNDDRQRTPDIVRKVRADLSRRTSDTSALERAEEPCLHREGVREKSPARRKFSLGSARRSSSLECEKLSKTGSMPLPTVRKDSLSSDSSKKKDPKTFSMTLFVNETEKNKIVDLLHKAKTIISKKVEKVMGKKPKSSISNVDALQTVIETWIDREQEEEKEDEELVESFIKEQEKQAMSMMKAGASLPMQVPTLAVQEDYDYVDNDSDDDTVEEEPDNDLEVSRLTYPVFLRPPEKKRPSSFSEPRSACRSLSPLDNVPCPFGNRPESELYGPKLRRPTSHYGAGAAAASSRPPSRQVSVSPSVPMPDMVTDNDTTEEFNEVEEMDEEDDDDDFPARFCRPDSFTIPIGGVWRPGDDLGETEVKWSKVANDEEYLEELKREERRYEKEGRFEEEGD